jgi:hypothetical protein
MNERFRLGWAGTLYTMLAERLPRGSRTPGTCVCPTCRLHPADCLVLENACPVRSWLGTRAS